ncbi:MAG: transketolase [Chitinophagales bacterium]|nr:transketolase [Chitinophagales bacterium]
MQIDSSAGEGPLTFDEFKAQVITDYKLAVMSREASLIGRKEVLRGKAKFGIFGDGKEVAQIALAKTFQKGDFRSGYYRDQTFAFAAEMCTIRQFFSQLYADTNLEHEPMSGGRSMNGHYVTRMLDEKGEWKNLMEYKNSSADTSPTASQMPRALGLALASKKFRECEWLKPYSQFSNNGNEVVFTTIGDASTSEGLFWETFNAAGVLKIPLAISVWDDGYGISVPISYQTTKQSISEIVTGFQTDENGNGIDVYIVNGWDYPALMETYERGIAKVRKTQIPALFHIKELTQPQGHSTSGSHERYKSKERLEWEKEFDCNKKMREWMLKFAIATDEELNDLERDAKEYVQQERKAAWDQFNSPIKQNIAELVMLLDEAGNLSSHSEEVATIKKNLLDIMDPVKKDLLVAAKNSLIALRNNKNQVYDKLISWSQQYLDTNHQVYTSHLYSQSAKSALNITEIKPVYDREPLLINGFEVLNHCFDAAFAREPLLFAFGEDLGYIGDVNQAFSGLQLKYGIERIFDTGIRETTIVGQGIGMAMRGLRPIAEIQYLDYLLFALQTMSDDLASLLWRTRGGQKAPLIIRTRGHRLEGIWHSGSPMGMILNAIRGIYLLVPRNMTQAAGFYNTMLKSDDPALIIECLNGYRLKERLPSNIGEFTVPLGVPEILHEGNDITVVTYGSCCRIATEAMAKLQNLSISVELIDVQTLLPFDIPHIIGKSVKKTNRILFLDEDVPGGASAYMYQQVMEQQNIWQWLDAAPVTLTAQANRPAYATDGDYFCKPNPEDVFEAIYKVMNESDPKTFPKIF